MSYEIKLPLFEGPFDLLLFFIERDELDIMDIPISQITNDFLDYVSDLEKMNIEVASEFIVVAATLMRIKSRMLLPRFSVDDDGNEIEELSWDAKIKTNQSLAKNLKGYLLLTHGNIDNNVHPTNSMRVADELIKAGKRFDMMIFPGKRHGYGSFRSYYEKMMWYYFSEHLLGDYRNNVDINLPDSGN